MMTIALAVAATMATLAFPAVIGNIQYDTSYLARWVFFLWWGTFTAGLWVAAVLYLKKGSKVYIEGKNQTRKWTAKDGGDRYTTEVIPER